MGPTRDQISEAYYKLPEPVRAFLISTKLYDLMQELSAKHGLHVDVAGKLANAVTNMLLGFLNPIQFQSELISMGITDPVADAITAELNERVFKPLRDEMRNAPAVPKPEPVTVSVPAPMPPPAPPAYQAPLRPAVPMPAPSITVQAPPPPPPPPIPHMEVISKLPSYLSDPTPPATVPKPKEAPVPINLPGVPAPTAEAIPPTPPVPPPASTPPVVQPRPYSADPYREAIE